MKILFEEICQSKGLKLTDQRKIVAKVLSESTQHPTVEELYQQAAMLDPNISLATVYRTVAVLESYGLIEKLDFADGRAHYEWKHEGDEHHHHLIDVESGKIVEFFDEELEVIKQKIAERLGYTLVDHRLELYGKKLIVPTKG